MEKIFNDKETFVLHKDSFEDILEAIENSDAEVNTEIDEFREQMESFVSDFKKYLKVKHKNKQKIGDHSFIASCFVNYLYMKTDVVKIKEITKTMVSDSFSKWYNRTIMNCDKSDFELKESLCLFFKYLANEKGIINKEVLKSFE